MDQRKTIYMPNELSGILIYIYYKTIRNLLGNIIFTQYTNTEKDITGLFDVHKTHLLFW